MKTRLSHLYSQVAESGCKYCYTFLAVPYTHSCTLLVLTVTLKRRHLETIYNEAREMASNQAH